MFKSSGCDKTKMRGHKCSYRVKLTMRLGYVNHWFVEVLGSHDQYTGPNYNHNGTVSHVPSLKGSNTPGSTPHNQRTPPGGREQESPSHSPKTTHLHNKNLPNSDIGNTSGLLPILSTPTLPKSLAPLVNNLPNSVLSSQPMGLPLAIPHILPMVSQAAMFSSQGCHNISLFPGAQNQYFSLSSQGMDQSMPQDVPLPLVKVKKEPVDVDEKPVLMETKDPQQPNIHKKISITQPQERAKARKRFIPIQRESRSSVNSVSSPEINGPKGDLENFIKKELRELVHRREHDRVTNEPCHSPLNYCVNGGKHDDDSYHYVWDENMEGSEVEEHQGQGQPKVFRVLYSMYMYV